MNKTVVWLNIFMKMQLGNFDIFILTHIFKLCPESNPKNVFITLKF